jgi:hypothetical protein
MSSEKPIATWSSGNLGCKFNVYLRSDIDPRRIQLIIVLEYVTFIYIMCDYI